MGRRDNVTAVLTPVLYEFFFPCSGVLLSCRLSLASFLMLLMIHSHALRVFMMLLLLFIIHLAAFYAEVCIIFCFYFLTGV